jgi:aminoglycoside phosphotransferase (APT) family kinase protein
MTASGHERYQAALQAACAAVGLDGRDAQLLHIRGNAVYHLPRIGVIARLRVVPGDPGAVRAQLTAALRVTARLRDNGYPATEPLDLDQPVVVDGHLATFWRYVTVTSTGRRDLAALGRLIRRLHSLPPADIPLPEASPLGTLRADLDASDAITPADRQWLLDRADDLEDQYQRAQWALGLGLIHGDAHAGNLLHAASGVILGDWDSVSHGPRELDLTPTSMWYRYGRPRAEWDAFCAAYGVSAADLPGLPLLQELRELHAIAAYIRNATGDAFRDELARRVTSLKDGNRAMAWRAL